jgi:preprotein translocase SecF subunit
MFNIVQKKSIFAIISILIVVAGIACYFINGGFNLDIDFAGGTEIDVPNVKYDEKAIIKAFEKIENVDVSSVQKVTETKGVLIKTKADLSAAQTKQVKEVLKDTFKVKEDISVQSISATVGKELTRSAVTSILIAAVLMLLYITFRFEVLSGIAAVVALVHDLAIMVSFYIIFKVPVNTSFIAALLTILGYSINATIVIFDRIRENSRLLKKTSFSDVVNTSIWQTLGRSINTSLTTLFTLVVLYIIGVQSIKEFALPLIVGIVAGTYSSVFISGPVWATLKGNKKAN